MYYVLKENYEETNVYVAKIPKTIKKQYQLIEGVSRIDDWPDEVIFQFSRSRPEGMNLTDWIENPSGWLLISNRFKSLLEDFNPKHIEYLPVSINNHKGRIASKDYWIANFTTLTKAVDRELSDFDEDPVDADEIFTFEKLILQEEILISGDEIFRLKELPRLILARQDLVERINKNGLTGMIFVETRKFKSLDPDA